MFCLPKASDKLEKALATALRTTLSSLLWLLKSIFGCLYSSRVFQQINVNKLSKILLKNTILLIIETRLQKHCLVETCVSFLLLLLFLVNPQLFSWMNLLQEWIQRLDVSCGMQFKKPSYMKRMLLLFSQLTQWRKLKLFPIRWQ